MDDEEYYEKMRNRNLNRGFTVYGHKKSGKKSSGVSEENVKSGESEFTSWSVAQGREDAEMLYERKYEDEDS